MLRFLRGYWISRYMEVLVSSQSLSSTELIDVKLGRWRAFRILGWPSKVWITPSSHKNEQILEP
jgi:hypothetical protein